MAKLIQSDPASTLQLAIPPTLRPSLPPEIEALLETPVNAAGSFEVYGTPPGDPDPIRRYAVVDGKRYRASVFGRRVVQPTTTSAYLVGIALDDSVALSDRPLRVLAAGETPPAGSTIVRVPRERYHHGQEPLRQPPLDPVAPDQPPPLVESGGGYHQLCCSAHLAEFESDLLAYEGATGGPLPALSVVAGSGSTGQRTVLYLRAVFPDRLRELQSEPEVYASLAAANEWFTEVSYGTLQLLPTVAPLVVLPRPESWYQGPGAETELREDASAVSEAMGYVPDAYDHVVVAYTGGPGNFSGLATIGGRSVWLKTKSVGVAIHELTHNLGLGHANSWETGGRSVIGQGTNQEYGNIYDTMGPPNAGIHHFSAYFKNRLNWLSSRMMHQVRRSGHYRIHAFDRGALDPAHRYAIVVQKDQSRSYWWEMRELFAPANPWTRDGLLPNWSPWSGSNGGTQLLDTNPVSSDKTDAALTIGRTFSDEQAGIHVTPVQKHNADAPSIDVVVNLGDFPDNHPPSASLVADQSNVEPGTEVAMSVSASDPDGDQLAYFWDFGDGDFSTENQPAVVKSWSATGRYVVRCVVSDTKGGLAADSVLVTVGSPSSFTVRGLVTVGGQPVINVHVHNGESGSAYRGAFTDSDGSYTIPNVTSSPVHLVAEREGYSFSPEFSNPLAIAGDVANADFTGNEIVLVSLLASLPEATEGGDSGAFLLSRTGSTTARLPVVCSVRGSASTSEFTLDPPLDFDLDLLRIVEYIPAGQSTLEITVTAIDDGLPEGPETAEFVIEPTAAYGIAGPAAAIVTINDPGASLPVVGLDVIASDAREAGEDGAVLFTRTGPVEDALEIAISTSGDATAGVDYIALGPTVAIPAGSRSVELPVVPIDDAEVEGGEEVVVTLEPGAGYGISSAANSATIFITDDDVPTLNIVATDSEASEEGSDPATFVIARTGDTGKPLTVPYAIGGSAQHGVDYAPLPGVLEIPAGASAGSVTIVPVDDEIGEPPQTVILQLVASTDWTMGEDFRANATIADNDVPVVTIGATDGVAGEPSDSATFRVTTRGSGSGSITLHYTVGGTATPDSDYMALPGSITMGRNATQTISIVPLDDDEPEDLETVTLSIAPDPAYTFFLDAAATINLIDDERPAVSVYPGRGNLSEQSGSSLEFYLQRTGSTGSELMVHYAMSGTAENGVDYELLSGTAIIPSGQAGVVVSTPIVPDGLAEGTETATLELLPDPAYGLGASSATRHLPDSDTPGEVVGFAIAVQSVAEDAGAVHLPVTLSAPAEHPVTVEYAIAGGTATGGVDYVPVSGLLTFDPGETARKIPLTILDDVFEEPEQTVVIELRHAWGAALGTDTFTLTIIDNDGPPPASVGFAATTSAQREGEPASILVSLSRDLPTEVTVEVRHSGGSATAVTDFLFAPVTLVFAPGETIRSIPVTILADPLADPGETIEFILSAPSGAVLGANGTHVATIEDVPVTVADADGDGLPDDWESAHGLDPNDDGSGLHVNGPFGDGDADGQNNLRELAFATHPGTPDGSPVESWLELDPADHKRYLTLRYPRRILLPTVAMELQVTDDHATWTVDPSAVEVRAVTPNPDGLSETVTVRILPSVEDNPNRMRLARFRLHRGPTP